MAGPEQKQQPLLPICPALSSPPQHVPRTELAVQPRRSPRHCPPARGAVGSPPPFFLGGQSRPNSPAPRLTPTSAQAPATQPHPWQSVVEGPGLASGRPRGLPELQTLKEARGVDPLAGRNVSPCGTAPRVRIALHVPWASLLWMRKRAEGVTCWSVAELGPKPGSLDPQGSVLSTVAREATPV